MVNTLENTEANTSKDNILFHYPESLGKLRNGWLTFPHTTEATCRIYSCVWLSLQTTINMWDIPCDCQRTNNWWFLIRLYVSVCNTMYVHDCTCIFNVCTCTWTQKYACTNVNVHVWYVGQCMQHKTCLCFYVPERHAIITAQHVLILQIVMNIPHTTQTKLCGDTLGLSAVLSRTNQNNYWNLWRACHFSQHVQQVEHFVAPGYWNCILD